jgi:hypothetical protein
MIREATLRGIVDDVDIPEFSMPFAEIKEPSSAAGVHSDSKEGPFSRWKICA